MKIPAFRPAPRLAIALLLAAAFTGPGLAAEGEKCPVDEARFRHVGPAYVDGQTGLTWRYCAAGQGIDMKTRQCQGAIFATDSYRTASEYAGDLAKRMGGLRMPTIDEVARLAEAKCGKRDFGRTPHADYGGAPIWTTTPAGPGKVYQYDPDAGGKVAVDETGSPGVILLLIEAAPRPGPK